MSGTKRIHVVAAAVFDTDGRVLIAKRPDHVHQGGLWEFPGGKVEPGETSRQALGRELHEEVGLDAIKARPLINVAHDYPDKQVLLEVWRVDGHSGRAHGREGQPVEWVSPESLHRYRFPAANRPIVAAVRLPDTYVITPEPSEEAGFLQRLERTLAAGARLVQLRSKHMERQAYRRLAAEAVRLCHGQGARVMLNSSADDVMDLNADGLHLDSRRLMVCGARPLAAEKWLAASCHNAAELARARTAGVDFVTLSPVQPTATHPGATPLGWDRFAALADHCPLPIYALGGLGPADRDRAHRQGAQGVAGIRGFW